MATPPSNDPEKTRPSGGGSIEAASAGVASGLGDSVTTGLLQAPGAATPAAARTSRARPAAPPPPKPDEDDDEDDDDEDDDDEDDDDIHAAAFEPAAAAGAFKTVRGFIGPFLTPYRRPLALILFGVLVETAFNVAFPLSLKYLIDDVFGGEDGAAPATIGGVDTDYSALIWILSILGVLGILVSITTIWYEWLNARTSASIVADIRTRLFAHAQTLSSSFYARTKSGQVVQRFSGDMNTVEDVVCHSIDWGVLPLFELVAGIGLMFFLNWQLALLAMLVFPLTFVGPRIFAPRAVRATYELKRREGAGLSVVNEVIGAQAVVKAFSLQRIVQGWFHHRNDAIRHQLAEVRFLQALVERSITITILLLHLVVFGIGAVLTYQGTITLGTFITFESVFWELSYNVGHLTNFIPQLIQGAGAIQHINDLLEEPSRSVDKPGAGEVPRLKGEIMFEDVGFSYDGVNRTVEGMSFTVPAGSRVAIVGPSGSGKSTTLSLLLRLYDPDSGRITLDGVDIGNVTRESLRNQMAVVFQDNVLFGASVRENIRLGNPAASDGEVEAAAKAAEIHKFIRRMPDGYDTLVGERGSTLSGGQRQRLAIARAIVRNPAILLLDEATSALDHGTEGAINRTLTRVGEGRTTLTVTHRIGSIADYDKIIVMQAGHIVQQGTHEDLMSQPGVYRSLFAQQSHVTELGA